MTLPEQIHWKLWRAKLHFEEFKREVGGWFNNEPGEMVDAPESTPDRPLFMYVSKGPVPARFGLIAGDYIQNLRSVLDYLVWHLIVANGRKPHETNTAFPICKSKTAFNQCYKRRLAGVPDEAIALIEALQPYPERVTGIAPQDIEILDELNNHNKHRQVLFTALASIHKPDVPVPFPHIELEVTRHRNGLAIPGERILAFLVFESGIAKGIEVTAALELLGDFIGGGVLPQFEKFL